MSVSQSMIVDKLMNKIERFGDRGIVASAQGAIVEHLLGDTGAAELVEHMHSLADTIDYFLGR